MKKWFTTKKVYKNTYAIAELSHWEKVVSYLVIGKEKAILIDSGMGYESILDEVKKITDLPICLFLTHAHWDHIGSAHLFDEVYIYDHLFEIEMLKGGFSSMDVSEMKNNKYFSGGFEVKQYVSSGIKSANLLQDKMMVGGVKIEVIHAPGHTPGSVCFYLPDENMIFTGDVLYPGPIYLQLEESSFEDYVSSLKTLKPYMKEGVKIFPGHNALECGVEIYDQVVELVNMKENGKIQRLKKEDGIHFSYKDVGVITKY